jgi:hypothetical protein
VVTGPMASVPHPGSSQLSAEAAMRESAQRTSPDAGPLQLRAVTSAFEVKLGMVRSVPAESAAAPAGSRPKSSPPPAPTWEDAVVDIEQTVVRAATRGVSAARREHADLLARSARTLIPRVERSARNVKSAEADLEKLHNAARDFRASLGNAIDTLLRERAQVRMKLEPLRGVQSVKTHFHGSGADPTATQIGVLVAHDLDLKYQLDQLQSELLRRNEAVDGDIASAAATLEGAISAYRHLSSELAALLDDAARQVSSQGEPRVRALV